MRAYAGLGTGILLLGAALLLAVPAVVKSDPRLWHATVTIVAYLIATRVALLCVLARRET